MVNEVIKHNYSFTQHSGYYEFWVKTILFVQINNSGLKEHRNTKIRCYSLNLNIPISMPISTYLVNIEHLQYSNSVMGYFVKYNCFGAIQTLDICDCTNTTATGQHP